MAKIKNPTTIVNMQKPLYFTTNGIPYQEEMIIPSDYPAMNLASYQNATNMKRFSVLSTAITNLQQYRLDGNLRSLEYVYIPYMVTSNTYGANALSLIGRPEGESGIFQMGSIGYPVTAIDANAFSGGGSGDNRGLRWTCTIYVNANTLADIPSAVKDTSPWGANLLTNIIYRNSTTGEVITA